MTGREQPPDPAVVAAIAAAVSAFEGRAPQDVRLVAVASCPPGPSAVPSVWALAGRLEQSRRRGRR
jgi:hypothetical protein